MKTYECLLCHQCLTKSVTHTVWHVWAWLPNLWNLQGSLRFICYCKGHKKRRFCLPSSNCSVCLWLWTSAVPYSYSTFALTWLSDLVENWLISCTFRSVRASSFLFFSSWWSLRWFLWKCWSMGTYVVKKPFSVLLPNRRDYKFTHCWQF